MWPEKLALVNLWGRHIYHVKLVEALETRKAQACTPSQTVGFSWRLSTQVTEAAFFEGLEISIKSPVSDAFLGLFRKAKLTVRLDGDVAVDDLPAGAFLEGNRTPIANDLKKDVISFLASPIGEDGKADQSKRLGYFCPNGAYIDVLIEIPPWETNVEIEVSLRMAKYTATHDGYKVEALT